MDYGFGEGLQALFIAGAVLIVAQIPFSLIGMWTAGCWSVHFLQQHWH